MHQPQIKPVQWLAIPNQLHADSTINIHVRGFALSAFHLFQHGSELLVELIKVIEGKVHASNVALDSFQIFFELFFCHVFNLRLFFLQHTGCPHEGFSSMRSSSFMRDLSSMVGGGKVGVGHVYGTKSNLRKINPHTLHEGRHVFLERFHNVFLVLDFLDKGRELGIVNCSNLERHLQVFNFLVFRLPFDELSPK